MEITETRINEFRIVSLNGNLALDGAAELKNRVKQHIDDPECKGMICNFKDVENVDSTGIGAIVLIYKALKRVDKSFAISWLNGRNRELFNLSRLDRIINLADNDDAALRLFRNV